MRGFPIQRLAQCDDVSAWAHCNADTQDGLAVESHVLTGRVDEAALDSGDVAEPNHAAIDADQGVADFSNIGKLTCWANEDAGGVGGKDSRACYRVLRIYGVGDLLGSEA